jgi:uncharacterized protein (TIGR03083 family)
VVSIRQYYEVPGVPMVVPTRPSDVASAWIGHRERVRRWLADLPEPAWAGATRCAGWSVTELVQHLASGSQFLGYTLHQAKKGHATKLLAAFDPQVTPAAAASQFAEIGRAGLLDALSDADDRVRRELEGLSDSDWQLPAEAPLGRVPAFVSVNHFLFDSWVHERDLMLPVGESPPLVQEEVSAVTSYVAALAGCAPDTSEGGAPRPLALDFALLDPDLRVCVGRDGATTTVSIGGAPDGAVKATGNAADFVDFATGRPTLGRVEGDPAALAFLRNLAEAMA